MHRVVPWLNSVGPSLRGVVRRPDDQPPPENPAAPPFCLEPVGGTATESIGEFGTASLRAGRTRLSPSAAPDAFRDLLLVSRPMGLTISYTVRLASRKSIPAFLAAAASEGRRRKWKVQRGAKDAATLEMLPHAKCDPVRLDFTDSLTCEEFVKTSFAPLRTHVQIVEFLKVIQPLAKSLHVEDECEYWETGDEVLLNRHRGGFDRAFGRVSAEGKGGDKPVKFTLGAVVVSAASKPRRAKRARVKSKP